jgi:ribosomal protein L34E
MLPSVESRLAEQRAERSRRSRRNHLKSRYGISVEQYNKMLESQDNKCAICGDECPTGRSLAVDHDHDTGRVRGLLCSRCNIGIGQLKNIANLAKAIEYLDNFQESA